MRREDQIGLAEAAARLRIPYQDAHRLLLTGVIRGEKKGGRWYVLVEDIKRRARELASDRARVPVDA